MKGKEMWRRDEVRLVICSEDYLYFHLSSVKMKIKIALR